MGRWDLTVEKNFMKEKMFKEDKIVFKGKDILCFFNINITYINE